MFVSAARAALAAALVVAAKLRVAFGDALRLKAKSELNNTLLRGVITLHNDEVIAFAYHTRNS
jgi:hypothetical protein